MKRKPVFLILILTVSLATSRPAHAALPTFDAVNAALSELRNGLMRSQFAQDIALAIERLNQLRAQYLELIRFHSGLDEIIQVFVGDPVREFVHFGNSAIRGAFIDFGWITPHIEGLGNAAGPADIRASLEAISGKMPDSRERPYIPFEEIQVVEGFRLAQEIRRQGEKTRDAARKISDQAKSASPKGAARLQAEAMSQVMVLSQQNQEAMAKLLELEATQIEQVTREEKRLEQARLKFLKDANRYLGGILEAR